MRTVKFYPIQKNVKKKVKSIFVFICLFEILTDMKAVLLVSFIWQILHRMYSLKPTTAKQDVA